MISVPCAPRSGTTYVHELLAATGLTLGHERPNVLGLVGFPFDLVDRLGLSQAVDAISTGGKVNVLVYRRPARAIASMQAYFGFSEAAFFTRHFGLEDPWTECWLQWNRACARRTDVRIRLEDIDSPETGAYALLCRALGLEPKMSLLPFFHPDHAKRLRPYDGGVADVDEEALMKEAELA